jgi:cephalosporin-C deacetylase-like acetyl esterase
MVVSVHDYDCGRAPREARRDFNELNRRGPYGRQGAPDREAYYFRRAILGIDRAINYLVSRDDFDGKHLVFAGASQGGGMALMLAGLNRHVTAVAATIPAMCEHSALLAGREAGWPKLLRGVGDKERHDYLEMGYYFDAVNFARSITCPVIVIAGLKDRTCPPSGIVAVYNVIEAPKRLFTDPRAGHQSRFPGFEIFRDRWIAGQLGLKEPVAPTKGTAQTNE